VVTVIQQGIAAIRRVSVRPKQRLVRRLDPQSLQVQLAPCFTRTAAVLGFDLAVFAVLAVLGWSLLSPWDEPLREGGSLMLLGLLAFALFWLSISEPDFYRYGKLRRRWLAAHRPPVDADDRAAPASRPVALSQWPEDMKAPMRVRSAYRPARPTRPATRWAWRAGARS